MNQLKNSILNVAAVASVLGLAACGGSQPAQPATPSSAQVTPSSSEHYGSTMGQRSTEPTGSDSAEHGVTSGTTSGTQSGTGQSAAGMSGTQGGTMSQGGALGTNGSTSAMGTNGSTGSTNSLGGSTDVGNLDDTQVAAVLQALNSGEIQQAQLALNKAKSPDVKHFAQKMVTAHREMQSSNAMLFSRLQITPSDNAVSNQLKSDGQSEMTTLQGMSGRDFDRDYIDGQVRAHNHALELVDRMVMNVKSSELRSEMQNARPKIEQHLRDAERIQQTLEQGQQGQGTSSKQSGTTTNGH